jgi:hypothetical protein
VVVVLVVDTPEAEARVEAELLAAEVELVLADPASVLVWVIPAEACVLLIQAQRSSVLRLIDRPPWPHPIAG